MAADPQTRNGDGRETSKSQLLGERPARNEADPQAGGDCQGDDHTIAVLAHRPSQQRDGGREHCGYHGKAYANGGV